MLRELGLSEELTGRRVDGVVSSITCGQCVIVFDDGTFVCLGVQRYRDGGLEVERQELNLFNFGDSLLVRSGIVLDRDELDRLREARDEEMRTEVERRERRAYERLREKYEGGSA